MERKNCYKHISIYVFSWKPQLENENAITHLLFRIHPRTQPNRHYTLCINELLPIPDATPNNAINSLITLLYIQISWTNLYLVEFNEMKM